MNIKLIQVDNNKFNLNFELSTHELIFIKNVIFKSNFKWNYIKAKFDKIFPEELLEDCWEE